MKKMADIQSELERSLSAPTSPLQPLTPSGHRVRVTIVDKTKNRKVRSDKSADEWSTANEIRISFEPGRAPDPPAAKRTTVQRSLADVVRALDRAESTPGYDFVALKWFRDAVLTLGGFDWAADESSRHAVLKDAIDKRLILTGKAPNPKAPQFPVTSIRLNRLVPEVKAILGTKPAASPEFEPVTIRGENLSTTILRERR
ncbi:MAG: hypothetical protein HYX25_02390 [Candidatus Solibacter usitatus]|nr:hypothetical protein [Candidatus Solibacter usitatus]